MLPTANAQQDWDSISAQPGPNAPTPPWATRRWRGPGRDKLSVVLTSGATYLVSRTRCSVLHGAPQSRDPLRRRIHGPRISSAPLARCAASGAGDLPVLIRRFPLLDERRHAFGAILQREGRVEQVALDVEAFGQRRLEGPVDGALLHRGGGARHLRDFFGHRQRLVPQLV